MGKLESLLLFNRFGRNPYPKIADLESLCLGQGIQEWTKQNLWKTAFKKSEVTEKI